MTQRQPSIQEAKDYVQALQQHIGSPTRHPNATVVVGHRPDPSSPLVVVSLTDADNRMPLDQVLIKMRPQIHSLIVSLHRHPKRQDDIKGWRHQPTGSTAAFAANGLAIAANATAAFNILLNASNATETLGPTIGAIPIFVGISMLITTGQHYAQGDAERKKATEIISRSTSFSVREIPDTDCVTGDAKRGVYAGIIATETCRLVNETPYHHTR